MDMYFGQYIPSPTGSANLDVFAKYWEGKYSQRWYAPLSITVRTPTVKPAQPAALPAVSEADVLRFNKVVREAFIYIGARHCMGPVELWSQIQKGLIQLKMTSDELDDVERCLFGWQSLTVEGFERYRFRYPERCPLLDVLCSLDKTHKELNDLADWLLELKGTKESRSLDALPTLPEPDGVRPACIRVVA